MAENKKSFVLYADLIKSIEHLTNEEKGILFNHLLEYVNDKNPILTDRLILTAWKPIELQLIRDLIKFEEVKKKRSDAGKRSAELRALKDAEQNTTNPTSVESVEGCSTNPTDNDTVNVNDTVIYIEQNEFLELFNKCRKHYDKVKTDIETLVQVEKYEFNRLKVIYNRQYFIDALTGFFEQKNMFTQTRIRPKHFLQNIELYNDCFHNKTQLYKPDTKEQKL